MNIRRKPSCAAILLALSVFLFEDCATIMQKTTQKIPVTSEPIGAKVLIDGKDVGQTPLILKLKRKKPGVIRIEKEGYNPHEIRITRNKPSFISWTTLGNFFLLVPAEIYLISKQEGNGETIGDALGDWFLKVFVIIPLVMGAVAVPLVLTDFATGAAYTLMPKNLDVELTPTGGSPRPKITEIDEAGLRDVKWLRVRAAALREKKRP
jgi:hypothetical protein